MKTQYVTQEYLKSILNYDENTGIFTWKERIENNSRDKAFNTRWKNKQAGTLNDQGYIKIKVYVKQYRAHILAWLYVYDEWPKNDIDHINGIRHDNKISNLREATRSENNQNIKKASKNNVTSGLLGVYFHKINKNFIAHIMINRKNIHLGCFNNPELAHEAYVKAKRELHPFGEL